MAHTEKTHYNQRKLNIAFAISAAALLAATIWMIVDDYDDAWRAYQATFQTLKAESLRAARADCEKELAALRQTESTDDASSAARVNQLQAEVARLDEECKASEANGWMTQIKTWPLIDAFNSPHHVIQDWLPDLPITLGMNKTGRFDRCRTCHLGIDETRSGTAPAFPHGTPKSADPRSWLRERAIPHPYASHPRLDIYLSENSPHPRSRFGCTSCHDGQGSGTSFTHASHTPNDPVQLARWQREYSFRETDFWQYPMPPKRFRETACLKCHHSVTELNINSKFGVTATRLVEGERLVRTLGCFACHEINGFQSGRTIGPDMRLEPLTASGTSANTKTEHPGTLRRPGGSLRTIGQKTTLEWIETWVDNPRGFQPQTRMPHFFHLANQQDADAKRFQPAEVAGIARYLIDHTQPAELLSPASGYQPDVERGRQFFSESGCLACHKHAGFENAGSDFGPDLTNFYQKSRPGEAGFRWLYTRIRDPQRHDPRSRMPNTFLEPYVQAGEDGDAGMPIDPAADVAAFLLEGKPVEYPRFSIDNDALTELVTIYLAKRLTPEQVQKVLKTRGRALASIDASEAMNELASSPAEAGRSETSWRRRQLNYVGERTIARFGCFGCHDIAGFERTSPVGVALQNWGRKDTNQLAFERIDRYLELHGEADGSSTRDRVVHALTRAKEGHWDSRDWERESGVAYLYRDLLHHGRAGFLWQKLRSPRSFDYQLENTKPYDARLQMPQYNLTEEQIESIATFILGLVGDPPTESYVFDPDEKQRAIDDGERLLETYNCLGCHMLELPEIRYGVDFDALWESDLQPSDFEEGKQLLLKLQPIRNGETGEVGTFDDFDEKIQLPIISFRGLVYARPFPDDDPIDQEFAHDLWETLKVNGKLLLPGTRMLVPAMRLIDAQDPLNGYTKPPRGGLFAEWLVDQIMAVDDINMNAYLAWQMVPPPLMQEGIRTRTSWLFQYLLQPTRLRHTTRLRMPHYHLDAAEARTLANYFAARDGVAFPYQRVVQKEAVYQAQQEITFHTRHPDKQTDYLGEAWKTLNHAVCTKCHAVGGQPYQGDPAKDARGPDLDLTAERLRPDWVTLWLYNPRWLLPYTSMPAPFPKNQKQFPELFGGDAHDQLLGVRDALFNYRDLIEREGKFTPPSDNAANNQ